jgi:methionyl-tRNA formyltransferase
MRPQAKPGVNFFTRVDIETDDRRRRLQERTGYSAPRLVGEALRDFEDNLVEQLNETERLAYYNGGRS